MGQAPSSFDSERQEPRIEDPETSPRGLALIAHGRFGSMNGTVVRNLAEYFRNERQLRVVTWDDLAVWHGREFHADWTIWTGGVAENHYNLDLHRSGLHRAAPDVVMVPKRIRVKFWPVQLT